MVMRRNNPNLSAKVQLVCKHCGNSFETWRRYLARGAAKYCSYDCSHAASRVSVTRNCQTCNAEFTVPFCRTLNGKAICCSRRCADAIRVTKAARKPLKLYGYRKAERDWQKAVRIKDGYICQRCGKYDPYVHAHHVATRKRRPDLRLDVSNGKCLCVACHFWCHNSPLDAVKLGLLSNDSYELARKTI